MSFVGSASKHSWTAVKLTGKAVGGASKIAYRGTKFLGGFLYSNREKIGGAAVGTAKGTAYVLKGIGGNVATKNGIGRCLDKIDAQTQRYRHLTSEFNERIKTGLNDKNVLLDTLIVSGESFATYATLGATFPSVQAAYEMAYPNLANEFSFAEQLERLEGEALVGFASGLKGKLFEKQYVDYLNNEGLGPGYYAELAESPTNAGWDIAVYAPDGSIDELLQAKATNAVSYVVDAIQANPQIDVVTTSEIHSHLAMQGFSDVIDSGISEESLSSAIETAFESSDVSISWMPSIVSLSIIAISASCQKNLSSYAKSKQFGERAMKAYFAFIVGGAVAVATNTWWLAILGGIGSRIAIGSGNKKHGELKRLKELIRRNERILIQMETKYA